MSEPRFTDDFSAWTGAVNDMGKATRDGLCDSLGGGYRDGKQVGGAALLSRSSNPGPVVTREIVGDAGNVGLAGLVNILSLLSYTSSNLLEASGVIWKPSLERMLFFVESSTRIFMRPLCRFDDITVWQSQT